MQVMSKMFALKVIKIFQLFSKSRWIVLGIFLDVFPLISTHILLVLVDIG